MTHLPAPSPSSTGAVEAVEIGSSVGGPATESVTPTTCASVENEQATTATQSQEHQRCKALCGFYGSSNTGGYCSRCWRLKLVTEFEARKAAAAVAASKQKSNTLSGSGRRIMSMGSRVKAKKKQSGDGRRGGSRSILESWVTKATTTTAASSPSAVPAVTCAARPRRQNCSGYELLGGADKSEDDAPPFGKELTTSSSRDDVEGKVGDDEEGKIDDDEEGKIDDDEERRHLEPPLPADENSGSELLETWAKTTVRYESDTTVLCYGERNVHGENSDSHVNNDNSSDSGGSPGRRRQPSQLQVEAMQFASSSIEVMKRNPRKTATVLCSGLVGGVAGALIAGPAGAVIGAKVCQVSTGAVVAIDSYAPVGVGGGGSSVPSSPKKGGDERDGICFNERERR